MALLAFLFLLLAVIALAMSLLSLLFPEKFVSFLPKKFRPQEVNRKTVSPRFTIMAFCFIALFAFIAEIDPNLKADKEKSQVQVSENAQHGEVTITVTDNDSVQANQENISYTVLPYSLSNSETSTKNGRTWASYKIILEEKDNNKINAENMLATAVSAAKYYADKENKQIVQVIMFDQKGENWGQIQLATITYAPDGKGFGNNNWYWDNAMSSKRTTTQQEKAICKAWNSMRKNYQTADGTDEERLKQAISQKLKISADNVHLPYLMWESPKLDFSQVKAQAPVK